ncbi:MAG: pirin family protein [Thaumarchaeota archaeon]|nr:MAG: pirin family protein [Nitrososphaerota archaeon]TLX89185.1 MAG: pirin family protein [Nitrososphaerota archaeon]
MDKIEKQNEFVDKNNETGNRDRSVELITSSTETAEGDGFIVHRSFPSRSIRHLDPFLLLDEMGPLDLLPHESKGFPDHPHRGFVTVTYMLEGRFEHKDSQGNSGKLGPGDVQWMTAGSGLVHSEMPEKEFAKSGGILHGFQLWINLPKTDKWIKPDYQDVPSKKIPVAKTPDGKVSVKVIAGNSLDAKAVINTLTPITYLHFTIQPGAKIVQPVPKSYNAFAYVINGKGLFGKDRIIAEERKLIVFKNDGDYISIRVSENAGSSLEVLLIAGMPINEPIVQYGPFVMNTQEEIDNTLEDYRNGRIGKIEI